MERLRAEQAAFGSNNTATQAASLRLGSLGGAVPPWQRIVVDVNGDIGAQVLQAAEIPSEFTRRDVAETIAQPWTWAAGQVVAFASGGGHAPPQATSRSTGTRLVIDPVGASTEYALGRDTSALWASVPAGADHRWYTSNIERLRLTETGQLQVFNGAGSLVLANSVDGSGALLANQHLYIRALSGGTIQFQSGTSQQIIPVDAYRENLGAINRKWLTLHAAELWVETLVAQDTMATLGGRVLVGPTTTLTRDCAPGDTTIYVKHNSFGLYVAAVEYGSKLVLQSAGKFEVMGVVNSAPPAATAQGDYPYVVERNWDGSGADQWYAGDAVFDTGKVTGGTVGAFIDLYSVRGLNPGSSAGPTIVGNVRTGHGYADWRERWAIGNLKGIYNNGGTAVFGAAFGPPEGMHLQIDATNGIRFLGGNNTATYGYWDMAANLSVGYSTAGQLTFTAADGALRLMSQGVEKMALLNDGRLYLSTGLIVGGSVAGTVGIVRSTGATAWNAGSGFLFHAVNGGATTALIGNSAGRRIQWDGANLLVISDGLTIDKDGIAMQQATAGATELSKSIRWGSGGYLWDASTGGDPRFEILRGTGKIQILANDSTTGVVVLQAGGSGVDRVTLTLTAVPSGPSLLALGGNVLGGANYPKFVPAIDNVMDLGSLSLRWKQLNSIFVRSIYGAFAGATSNLYYVEVGADSAAKPTSSTWIIATSSRASKHAIEDVDPADALARVCRVPVVRYRTNDGDQPAIGVIAEDVRDTLPLSVHDHGEGRLDWNAHELFMLNVAAVQALAQRLDRLERKARR